LEHQPDENIAAAAESWTGKRVHVAEFKFRRDNRQLDEFGIGMMDEGVDGLLCCGSTVEMTRNSPSLRAVQASRLSFFELATAQDHLVKPEVFEVPTSGQVNQVYPPVHTWRTAAIFQECHTLRTAIENEWDLAQRAQ